MIADEPITARDGERQFPYRPADCPHGSWSVSGVVWTCQLCGDQRRYSAAPAAEADNAGEVYGLRMDGNHQRHPVRPAVSRGGSLGSRFAAHERELDNDAAITRPAVSPGGQAADSSHPTGGDVNTDRGNVRARDNAEGVEELREQIARWLWNDRWNDGDQDPDPANAAMPWDEAHPVQQQLMRERADSLLTLPGLAPLVADRQAVKRVEHVLALYRGYESSAYVDVSVVRRALDGDR
ncbi:hypothetical protein [Blastococcus mobilis]|uniref:Uncharacterized protein n=1 Tax=Blastococcus mobilis TaxID=1938746 RepID=A0A238VFA1_9ACTN|nr:hypothetical protein [Blastococcus mobilis]SNR32891.1 hypothetical protein SAMN06272737_10364 [Blastococcus mobilis]